jgi:cardiolipin synthase
VGTTASSLDILWDRQAEWRERLTMITQARQFVYVSLFYLEFDDYGRPFVEALTDAARRGVRVQLIIDGFGQRLGGVLMSKRTRAALDAAFDQLRRAGGDVRFYRPPHQLQRWMGAGHHYKIQISDAGAGLLASGNVTKSSFDGWNECAVRCRGAIVPVLLERAATIGGEVASADLDALRSLPAGPTAIPIDFWFCNPNDAQGPGGLLTWDGRNYLTDRMVEMVEAATRSLAITSFYFKPTPRLLAAVVAAAKRGVRVEVFHSHRDALPATDLAWIASAACYPELLAAGVVIHERVAGEHSKIVLVDDAWVALGSYNFEDAAHDRLAEAMLATRDTAVVESVAAIIDRLRSAPGWCRVTPEVIDAWPLRLRRRVRWLGRFKRWL